MKRSIVLGSLCLLLAAFLVGEGTQTVNAAPVTLKLGLLTAPGGEVDKGAQKFKELVESRTKGAVKIEVYPAAQLGTIREMLEGLSMGTNDMAIEAMSFLGMFDKDVNFLNAPFLFKNEKEMMSQPVFKEVLERVRKKNGIRTLSYNGLRSPNHLFTKTKPVTSLEELKGVKLRVPGVKAWVDVWNGLGAIATVIPWSEVYMALAQNVVDGMPHNAIQIRDDKLYEQLKYVTLLDFKPTVQCVWISEAKYLSLSPENQKILTEAAVESGAYFTQITKQDEKGAWNDLKKAGLKIFKVDRDLWFEKARPVLEKMEASGAWSKGLLARAWAK